LRRVWDDTEQEGAEIRRRSASVFPSPSPECRSVKT